ncbi:hypothetical protein OA84_01955 [Kaistella solincola]|uniref:TonB-dependent receptor n=1 Tax=Kaistella solincola TaxID=510955 RepID=A0ABR4ZTR7_9FLAO|nr:hypothetical protein OA84_01955 [Kaistella solincola]
MISNNKEISITLQVARKSFLHLNFKNFFYAENDQKDFQRNEVIVSYLHSRKNWAFYGQIFLDFKIRF